MKEEPFKAERVTCKYTQKINSNPEVIFPLLCPEKEKLWLSGWDYEMIWSKDGVAEKDCVFFTSTEKEKDTIWVNSIRDMKNWAIEFVLVTPELRATTLNIMINPLDSYSEVIITYTSTALNEAGNLFLKELFTKDLFDQRMKWWEDSMNHYIATGKMLKLDH